MTKSSGSRVGARVGTKSIDRQRYQQIPTAKLLRAAHRQVGSSFYEGRGMTRPTDVGAIKASPSYTPEEQRQEAEFVNSLLAAPGNVSEDAGKEICDLCGKTVRVKKDGGLYAHKCVG